MAGRRQAPAGASVRIRSSTHARVVLACETLGMSVSEWMDRAALASLQKQEEAGLVNSYRLACSAAEAARKAMPNPEDYGLARDYGIPLHPIL